MGVLSFDLEAAAGLVGKLSHDTLIERCFEVPSKCVLRVVATVYHATFRFHLPLLTSGS